jgi:hypothetical protein
LAIWAVGGLKEVSVSYGSNGEEETSKTTPMGGYMVDMKNEKSLQAEKGENRMCAQFMN